MPLRVWWQFTPMRIASVKVSAPTGMKAVPLDRAANEDDLVHVLGARLGILERLLDRGPAAADQCGRQLLELGPAQRHLDVLGA